MGQQQLLLIILGVIIVGIAIAVGLSLFSAQSIQANKDAIINDLNNVAAHAYQYKIRPASMAGGDGKYTGYKLPTKMATNENATYSPTTITATDVTVTATSVQNTANTVVVIINAEGRLGSWTFAGDFL
jgi:hypothetical protein